VRGYGQLFVEVAMMGCATVFARGMDSMLVLGMLVGRRNWTLD
jgi:hypothetical protein